MHGRTNSASHRGSLDLADEILERITPGSPRVLVTGEVTDVPNKNGILLSFLVHRRRGTAAASFAVGS